MRVELKDISKEILEALTYAREQGRTPVAIYVRRSEYMELKKIISPFLGGASGWTADGEDLGFLHGIPLKREIEDGRWLP